MGEVFTLQAGKNITAKEIKDTATESHSYKCYGGNGIRGFVASYNREGDFPIIGRQGALCGNVNIAKGKFYATEHAVVVERYCDVDLIWAYYTLITLNLNQYATATAQPGLSVAVINDVYIPIPPQKEQERISQEIEYWFALIEQIEQGKADLQTTIKQTKNRILDLAIHGKLVPQDPDDEPAIELLKRISPDFAPCDNGHSGKLPQGWCNCKISDVSISLLGKTLDRGKNTGNLKKYLCAVNVKWGTFELSTVKEMPIEATELERYSVKFGDLMVCEGGDVGRAAIWTYNSKMYYQNALHRIRFKENISAHYFLYSLMYLKLIGVIDDVCKGVTIKHLTQNAMNTLKFNLPPIAEQQRIVQKIEELFSILDNIQNALEV